MEQEFSIFKIIRIVADIMTISGITILTIWSSFRKDKEVFAFKINLYFIYFLRSVGIVLSAGFIVIFIKDL